MSLSVTALDDDQGQPLPIQLQLEGITVTGAAVCPQLPSTSPAAVARDLNGDGRCEDINGNTRRDFNDVVVFFTDLGSPAVLNSVSLFDFNGNRRIDFDDVATLFRIVTGQ